MMQELTERVVKVETRLDIQDKRLGSHGDRIGNLEQYMFLEDAENRWFMEVPVYTQ